MALIVQKYGGSSVATLDRIRHVAARALETQRQGNHVVVIVSAMQGETNRLLALAEEASPSPNRREIDAIAATGEQISSALTALAIQAQGGKARSLLGHQVKVITDSSFTKARIKAIEGSKIFRVVEEGEIAVVAGFQGVDDAGNITTLGRGGSDTTAVAIAAAIGADSCEIYTDVEGVYTTDPSVCPSARKIDRISYEEMLELASLGAKILQIRSVEIAMKYGVPIHVRSSFSDAPGTWVVGEDKSLEDIVVAGIAYDKGDTRVQILSVLDQPGVVAQIFGSLARENIAVDMIIQGTATETAEGPRTNVTFTMPKADLAQARSLIEATAISVGATGVTYDEDIVKVSIVGLGMRSHAGIAAKMFEILAREGINIQAISTSEIKVSCIIASRYLELAVRALHDGFELHRPPKEETRGGGR